MSVTIPYRKLRKTYVDLAVRLAPPGLKRRSVALAEHDFDSLCERREVLGVNVRDDALYIHRACVTMANGAGLPRDIGEYLIKIIASDMPNFFNLTARADGYHGPHIDAQGRVCIGGDDQASVLMVLGDGRLASVGTWAVDAVAVLNLSDSHALANLERWPIIGQKKGVGT